MVVRRHVLVLLFLVACVAAILVLRRVSSRRPGNQGEQPRRVTASIPEPRPLQAAGEVELSKTTGPTVPPSLKHIFADPTGTARRMRAVAGLPKDQPPEALKALRGLLKQGGEDEALRNNVANTLRECGEPNLVSDLTEMLWDENETPKWRNYCVQHLYQCYEDEPNPETLETLFKATEVNEKMVRICAVWSLARVATPRSPDRIPDEKMLGKIRPAALGALREKDAHFLITEAGVQSCARLGLTEALPEIRSLAGSADTKPTHLRVVAVAALGELKDAESAPLLERLSNEATGQLQAAAQLALKRISEAEEAGQPEPAPEDRF